MSIVFVVQPGAADVPFVLLLLLASPSPALILFALTPTRGPIP